MASFHVRPARPSDLPDLTEIYNHYIINTAITFDIEPFTTEQRGEWFEEHADTGRYRPLAAEDRGRVIGTAMYRELFNALANEDINRVLAGITPPNEASVALHERFGFRRAALFSENGRKFGRFWNVAWFERPARL